MDIKEFFLKYSKVAIAFSGGVDSAYLLYMAKKYAKDVQAYYVKSAFQPAFEKEDAIRMAEHLKVPMNIIELDVLADSDVVKNPSNRCYYCKRQIFSQITKQAAKDGYKILLDGTNASDDVNDRPGMKALQELSVLSPLRECGLTKTVIREQSRLAGLFTWNKPAYACLATRIPTGTQITAEKLLGTERAEDFLRGLGISDFRVRMQDGAAKIQVPAEYMEKILMEREKIVSELKKYYNAVWLDMEARG